MAVVYPGLVNIDNSPITVTTVNVYDDNQRTHTYDLSDQIVWDSEITDENGVLLEGDALIAAQTPLKTFRLPSPARVNTLIVILDGLTLSPRLSPNSDHGDYQIIDSTTVEFVWDLQDCPRMHSSEDTPVLLVRYTLA